ncbi:MAG: hypothetical protein KW804_01240 [Candidatus Doudnabacteria bacterium]|nr:hypothetical protein [Candidatus Doudnabacteria bacterium]
MVRVNWWSVVVGGQVMNRWHEKSEEKGRPVSVYNNPPSPFAPPLIGRSVNIRRPLDPMEMERSIQTGKGTYGRRNHRSKH